MTTRLFLPSSGAAAVSPAFGAWDITTAATRRSMAPTRSGTYPWPTSFTDSDMADQNVLLVQFVSPPLTGDQSIPAGTAQLVLPCREHYHVANMALTFACRVVSGDGLTERGELVPLVRDDREMPLGGPDRTRVVEAGSYTVDAQGGDRIVLEVGAGGDPAMLGHWFQVTFGDHLGGNEFPAQDNLDLAISEMGWFELSAGLVFA